MKKCFIQCMDRLRTFSFCMGLFLQCSVILKIGGVGIGQAPQCFAPFQKDGSRWDCQFTATVVWHIIYFRLTKEMALSIVKCIYGADTADMSFLFFLRTVRQCGGFQTLASVRGGLQVTLYSISLCRGRCQRLNPTPRPRPTRGRCVGHVPKRPTCYSRWEVELGLRPRCPVSGLEEADVTVLLFFLFTTC